MNNIFAKANDKSHCDNVVNPLKTAKFSSTEIAVVWKSRVRTLYLINCFWHGRKPVADPPIVQRPIQLHVSRGLQNTTEGLKIIFLYVTSIRLINVGRGKNLRRNRAIYISVFCDKMLTNIIKRQFHKQTLYIK